MFDAAGTRFRRGCGTREQSWEANSFTVWWHLFHTQFCTTMGTSPASYWTPSLTLSGACERSGAVRISASCSRSCWFPPLPRSKPLQVTPLNIAPISPRSTQIARHSLQEKKKGCVVFYEKERHMDRWWTSDAEENEDSGKRFKQQSKSLRLQTQPLQFHFPFESTCRAFSGRFSRENSKYTVAFWVGRASDSWCERHRSEIGAGWSGR